MFEEEEIIRNYKVKNRLLIILFKNKVKIFSFKIEKDGKFNHKIENTGENFINFSKILLEETFSSNEPEIKGNIKIK